ncbi:spore coat U domain-containing protein [Affinibrenneria salicis]|uniref:Spore coat U domain-containing protein n=1 Tax=Affinibrenneria salicis TaxID=2590031 RepID=A0A5J5FTV7_9GAMM|nr:spore coat U domain-containing protein [Affinibrenneria salicis]KAA8996951.1 spore coat U domain-containing protein [Affinibrenneria salicis]
MRYFSLLRIVVITLTLLLCRTCLADCSVITSSSDLGTLSSFTVNNSAQTVETGSGFNCSGGLLTLLSSNTVTATFAGSLNPDGNTMRLYNAASGDYLPYNVCSDSACSTLYSVNSQYTWRSGSLLGLLGLFNSPDGSLPLYVRTTTGANLAAGVYTDTVTINWHYHICFIGVLGICAYTDGDTTSTVNLTLTVANDCTISAPDINFGTAALPAEFAAVSGNMNLSCTKAASWSINLTSSHPDDASWRRMSASVNGSTYYLQYQLYNGNNVSWTENNDYAGTGSGLAQSIPYTARINAGQSNQPAGEYSDSVTVTVTF